MTLRNAVEAAGMLAHCDFEMQVSATGVESRLRPDMIVKLPGRRQVIVDAKTPLESYLEAMESDDPDTRTLKLTEHAKRVRKHIGELSAKSYTSQFDDTPEFVIMFLPGEALFSAALTSDPRLIEEAAAQNVILASPTILIALLRAVAFGWQQQQLAENAARIGEKARELFSRVSIFAQHFAKIEGGLKRSVEAYNSAVGSWTTRVVPSASKLIELGATPDKKLPSPDFVEEPIRTMPPPEDPPGRELFEAPESS
jgi:DNA recombination protein RmuC